MEPEGYLGKNGCRVCAGDKGRFFKLFKVSLRVAKTRKSQKESLQGFDFWKFWNLSQNFAKSISKGHFFDKILGKI